MKAQGLRELYRRDALCNMQMVLDGPLPSLKKYALCRLRVSELRQLRARNPYATNGFPIHSQEEESMNWKTPKIVEIALGAEINCYACADLK